MKEFFKYVGATVVGLLLTGILAFLFFIIGLVGLAAASGGNEVKDNTVLVLNLSGILQERASGNSPLELLSDEEPSLGVNNVVTAILKAKTNEDIKGIYIEAGAFAADSYASLQAIHDALEDFRKSGKWIIAYGDTYTQGAYYLASTASKIYINPQGMIDWHGIASQPYYLKDFLAKFGVKVQVAKVGTYKSATETFTADGMSDANRAQTSAYITAIWNNVTSAVSKSRNISVGKLNQLADSMVTLADANVYVKEKMVDGLLYTDQVKEVVKKQLGIDEDDDINQVAPSDVIADDDSDDGDEVAVYYACGEVVDGAASWSNGPTIDAQKVCRDLEKLADDDDVKAVVIRVNSGGGSAYASEQIWHQVSELKKKKPVIVSMGGMAASGAYYLSAPANWIVAEPTTLTGSIGIFGMFPDMSGLLQDKLGLKFDVVKTNAHSDFETMVRPFNDEEMRHLEAYINRGYTLFRQRVADGRHMTTAQVEKIAQGHVFAGQDAIKIHLVDQLGSLDDAVKKAAQLAKIDEYYPKEYPNDDDDFIDMILGKTSAGNYLDAQMRSELGPIYEPVMLLRRINQMDAIQARLPFTIGAVR